MSNNKSSSTEVQPKPERRRRQLGIVALTDRPAHDLSTKQIHHADQI